MSRPLYRDEPVIVEEEDYVCDDDDDDDAEYGVINVRNDNANQHRHKTYDDYVCDDSSTSSRDSDAVDDDAGEEMELLSGIGSDDDGITANTNPNEQFIDDELTRKLKNRRKSSDQYYLCCNWCCLCPKLALCILISGIIIALTGVVMFGRPQGLISGGGGAGHFPNLNPLKNKNKKDAVALPLNAGYSWVPAGQVIVPPKATDDITGYAHAISMSGDGNLLAVGLQGNQPGSGSVDVYGWVVVSQQDSTAIPASEEGETIHEAEVDGEAGGGTRRKRILRSSAGGGTNNGQWRLRGTFVPAPGHYAHRGGEHQAVALSSDGRYLAFTGSDKVFIHRLVTESDFSSKSLGVAVESEHGTKGHFGKALAFSANGASLIVAAEQRRQGFVRVVSAQPPQLIVEENETTTADDNELLLRRHLEGEGDQDEAPSSFDKWEKLGQDVQNTRLGTPVAISGNGTRIAVVKTNNFVSVMDYNATILQWRPIGRGDDMPISLGGYMTMSACGKVVAVSSEYDVTNSVQVYQILYNETLQTSSWQPMGEALHGESKLERFGASLALNEDGRVLAVGAPGTPEADTDDGYYKYGHVNVYQYDKRKDAWVKVGDEMIEMEEEEGGRDLGNLMGGSVAISGEGSRIAAGAPQRGVGDAPHVGSALVYEWGKAPSPPAIITAPTAPTTTP